MREALLNCNNADRAYLRRWILRWIDEYGHIHRDAEKLPKKGCCRRTERTGEWPCAR